jgi:hypothetical protein
MKPRIMAVRILTAAEPLVSSNCGTSVIGGLGFSLNAELRLKRLLRDLKVEATTPLG